MPSRGGWEGEDGEGSGNPVVHTSGNNGGGGEAGRGFESNDRDVLWRTAAAKGRGWEVIGVDGNDEGSGVDVGDGYSQQ